jgi:tRNA/tmRNA/rRNA uracil-C5-methylase (TrmA/RlmC/RlmD family)
VYFPPGAFGQNHLPLFERAVDRIAALVPDDSIVAEMYCGVGSIGLGLLGQAREMRFNERSPDGLNGLEMGLVARPAEERARARIFTGSAGERVDAAEGADVVLVDPPRRGLDPELCAALAARPPRRLVYLACGLDRLLEDLGRLRAPGRLRLAGIEIYDFFPFTEHVETLVWLDAAP